MAEFTIAALRTELTTDPKGLGYSGEARADLALLTEPRAICPKHRRTIPTWEVYGKVVWTDFIDLPVAAREVFRMLTAPEFVDASSQNVRDAFVAVFGAGSATIVALTAILSEPGSRAEELWGDGVTVTGAQVQQAWEGV